MQIKEQKNNSEPKENNRSGVVQRRFSLCMYLAAFAALFYPWLLIGEERYNVFSFAFLWRREGTAAVLDLAGVPYDPSYGGGFGICLTLFLVYTVLSLFYVATVLFRKKWNMNYAALFVCVVLVWTCREDYMPGRICKNEAEAILFPAVFLFVSMSECVGRKMIGIWDETLKETLAYQEEERRRKAERKRRLAFPGKYSKLFYEAVWKNFKGNLKDYIMLFICHALVFMVVLTGFGLHSVIKDGDESLKVGYPVGAGKILLESLVEFGTVGVFMLVLLLLYYLKRRIPEYGMFSTLGIRRKTMYLCMGVELGIGGLLSLLAGGILGAVLVEVLKKQLGEGDGGLTPLLLLAAMGVMALFYLVIFFVTHDLFIGFRMGNSADLSAAGEKMPKKHYVFFMAAGACICILKILEYGRNVKYENIDMVIVCFIGIYLILRYGMAKYLKSQRKQGRYLSKIFRQHSFYHRSRSAVWYIFGLCVIQICILGLFSVQLFSTSIIGNPDDLSPYDLVCLAGESGEDASFIQSLRERDNTQVEVCPMVRVIGECAEQPGRFVTTYIYGQNIGISESSYHALKQERESSGYKSTDLGFGKDGTGIYLVHQMDKSSRARPLDYKMAGFYVGTVYEYDTGYDEWGDNMLSEPYEVVGEETSALTGIMCQGERENIVVFSDTYFEQARKRAMALEYPGPTELVLVKTDEKTLKELEPDLEAFRKRHEIDERYDAKVKSYYLKGDAKKRFLAELHMRKVMAELLIPLFFMAFVLLIKIKLMTERTANERRTEFLNCMGMRKKERTSIMRLEMGIYFVTVLVISAAVSAGLIRGAFCARFYEAADILFMLKKIVPFVVCEMAEFGMILFFMTEREIWRLEKKYH